PETETFCFNLEEISSGSPTSYSDLSLPDYEAFYFDDDHIKEKSSGNTTTHADFSQYDPFIFDLSIDSFPLTDRSDFYHEEFADELAHIISPPEYDCFYIKSEPDPGELTSIVDFGIRENVLPTTNVNLPFEDAQSPLWAYVVWIFLSFLTYPVTRGNEDTIFDPDISVYDSFMLGSVCRDNICLNETLGVKLKFCDRNDLDKECVTVYQNHGTPTVLPCRDKDLRQGLETGGGAMMTPMKVEESEGKKDKKNRNNKKRKEVLDEEVKVSGCSSRRGFDIAVQSCFLDIQLTRLSPKNCIPPEVIFRVSRQPAWSASEKAVRGEGNNELMDNIESSDEELKDSDYGNLGNERNQKYHGSNISKVNDIILNNAPHSDNIKDEKLNERVCNA
ncbi:hypothetical protein Tco_0300161, partial [Tanacetum coccineum]